MHSLHDGDRPILVKRYARTRFYDTAERVLGLPGGVRVDKDVAFKDVPTGAR